MRNLTTSNFPIIAMSAAGLLAITLSQASPRRPLWRNTPASRTRTGCAASSSRTNKMSGTACGGKEEA